MVNEEEAVKTEPEGEVVEETSESGKIKDEETPTESTVKVEDVKKEEPSTELLEKIKYQVEYYFGDVNMQRDKFLQAQTKLDDGWIPLTIMLNFKMLAKLSKDSEVILRALASSDLMEISEDKKKIRRSLKHPLPTYNEEYRKAQEARTVYIKGFPLTNIDIEKLRSFLEPFETFENIVMRKYQDAQKNPHFKGSIFIQFKTLDDAQTFMARESVQYEGTELIRKWSSAYAADKSKEREEIKRQRAANKGKNSQDGKRKREDTENKDVNEDVDLPKGSTIYMSEVPDNVTMDAIKRSLQQLGILVAFIDYNKGDKLGWIRLQGENTAASALKKLESGKLKVHVWAPIVRSSEESKIKEESKVKEDEEKEAGSPSKQNAKEVSQNQPKTTYATKSRTTEIEIECRLPEGDEEDKYLARAKVEIANVRGSTKYKRKKGGIKGRLGGKFKNSTNNSNAGSKTN